MNFLPFTITSATCLEESWRALACITACEENFTVAFGIYFTTSLTHVTATNHTIGAILGATINCSDSSEFIKGVRAVLKSIECGVLKFY